MVASEEEPDSYETCGGVSPMATEDVGHSMWQSLGEISSSIPQSPVNITVNKDNVLQAAKIIQGAVDQARAAIYRDFQDLAIMPPGQDPVSVQAAKAWTAKILTDPDSYQVRVNQYLASLDTLVNNLKTSALQYGYTEQQITDALNQSVAGGA